jgi:hypothetical protein
MSTLAATVGTTNLGEIRERPARKFSARASS